MIAFAGAVMILTVATLNLATGFQVLLGAIGAATVVAVGSTKRKDATIKDFREALEGASARANEEHEARRAAETQAARLEGQVEELRQYAAPEAFKELASAIGRLDGVMGTAIREQGELIMQASALTAGQTVTLEKISEDLGLLAERLGSGGDRPIGSA